MWRTAGTAGTVGMEIAFSILLGYLGGQWLDQKLGTAPWLEWLGLVCGVGASIKALVRVTRQYKRSLKEDEHTNPPR